MRRTAARWLAVVAAVLLTVAVAPAASATPGPPAYPEWWFDQWQVESLWAQGFRGGGVTVAIIDTGVQASVPQISANVVPGTDLTGLGGDGRVDRSSNSFSHGTAMASLIVAQGGNGYVIGVAPDAKILPVAVPLGETDNSRPDADETPAAIRYAVDHGATVISMSFGGERVPSATANPCPEATQSAIFYALGKGALLVASGGNSGETGSPVEEPGVCLGVISVGAVDKSDSRASFSSAHPYLTVAAPGAGITTLNKNGEVFVGSGTSQAAALASGALALIWSAHPDESNREISARLLAGVRDAGDPGRDDNFGHGIVDADASISSTPDANTPNPPFTSADPFLEQLAATPDTLTVPEPVTAAEPPSGYHRAAPATGYATITLIAAGAAGLGLVALLVLSVAGGRARQARRAHPDPPRPVGT